MSTAEDHILSSGQTVVPACPRPAPRALSRHSLTGQVNKVPIVQDRRRHQRVNVPLNGRFMRTDKKEFPCQITNISPGGIAILAPITCDPGEQIVLYLDEFGRLEGNVVRSFATGFAIRLTGTAYKREKIANQLTWILNKSQLDLVEDRAHGRNLPSKPVVEVTLTDDTVHECHVLDASLGGISISIQPRPALGNSIMTGMVPGKVVRHHDHGIAIRFDEALDPSTIERQFR